MRERTAVVVVAELRAEDVVREFLEGWLGLGRGSGGSENGAEWNRGWRIWSLSGGDGGEGKGAGLGPRYGMWIGWKV